MEKNVFIVKFEKKRKNNNKLKVTDCKFIDMFENNIEK